MHETESLYDEPLYNATVYRRDLTVKDEEFWYPVAQNINVLESIAYWAASGRGAGAAGYCGSCDGFLYRLDSP